MPTGPPSEGSKNDPATPPWLRSHGTNKSLGTVFITAASPKLPSPHRTYFSLIRTHASRILSRLLLAHCSFNFIVSGLQRTETLPSWPSPLSHQPLQPPCSAVLPGKEPGPARQPTTSSHQARSCSDYQIGSLTLLGPTLSCLPSCLTLGALWPREPHPCRTATTRTNSHRLHLTYGRGWLAQPPDSGRPHSPLLFAS
jgi:hypothetical protein